MVDELGNERAAKKRHRMTVNVSIWIIWDAGLTKHAGPQQHLAFHKCTVGAWLSS